LQVCDPERLRPIEVLDSRFVCMVLPCDHPHVPAALAQMQGNVVSVRADPARSRWKLAGENQKSHQELVTLAERWTEAKYQTSGDAIL
jgi:hypothetical protein